MLGVRKKGSQIANPLVYNVSRRTCYLENYSAGAVTSTSKVVETGAPNG